MDNLKRVFQESSLFLLTCYVAGFFAWNSYLSKFGFFEYDLLQTRFISAGLLVLFFPILIFTFYKKTRDYFLKLDFPKQLFSFIIWIYIFTSFVFPYVPQYLGGARPTLASIVSNSEITESFKLMGFLTPQGNNKQVETTRGCKIYENNNQVLIGLSSSAEISRTGLVTHLSLEGARVLVINKAQIEALSLLPQTQVDHDTNVDAYTVFCNTIRSTYGADLFHTVMNFFLKK